MKVVLSAEGDQWQKATTEYERIMAKGATQSFRKLSRVVELAARQAVGAAGFTSNVQRTIQALNKPPSGYVLNPRVWLHSTVNYLDVFEEGRTITGSPLLWLPLPTVPPHPGSGVKFGGLVGRPHMTPSQYIRTVGRLIKVVTRKHGGLIMLGAMVEGPDTRPSRGRLRRTFLKQRFHEKTRPTHFVPLFIGIARISIPKKFDTEQAAKSAVDGLEKAYNELVEPYEGRPSGN